MTPAAGRRNGSSVTASTGRDTAGRAGYRSRKQRTMSKRTIIILGTLLTAATCLRGDVVRLASGKTYQGAVIEWGDQRISFVLQGGTMSDSFAIPIDLVAAVVLPDSSEHVPGTASWIAAGRADRLPWDETAAQPAKPEAQPTPARPKHGRPSLHDLIVRLAPVGRMESGHTTYQITFPWGPYFGNSRLDYPLDGYSAGVRASALTQPFGASEWQLGADLEVAKNMSDPRHDMTDSDWVSVSESGSASQDEYRLVISATTSASRSSNWDISSSVSLTCPVGRMLRAGALLGYRYLRLQSDLYGVTGWQDTSWNRDLVFFDELHETRVLQYTVSYKLPMVGLVLLSESSEGLTLQARGAYLPGATADDQDVHSLRNKRSDCSAGGSGWQWDGEAAVRLATLANGATIELAGRYQYLKVNTTGSQTQTYFGDDPGIDGDQTGWTSDGIDDQLSIRRQSIGLSLAYTF